MGGRTPTNCKRHSSMLGSAYEKNAGILTLANVQVHLTYVMRWKHGHNAVESHVNLMWKQQRVCCPTALQQISILSDNLKLQNSTESKIHALCCNRNRLAIVCR